MNNNSTKVSSKMFLTFDKKCVGRIGMMPKIQGKFSRLTEIETILVKIKMSRYFNKIDNKNLKFNI